MNQDPLTNNCTKWKKKKEEMKKKHGNISVVTKIRMFYAGKDLWTAKDKTLLMHWQYSDLLYHSFKQIFPLHQSIFSLYLLVRTQRHKGCSLSCMQLKWNLEAGKREKPCPKYSFNSKVLKDIKQSTQRYCCKKVSSAIQKPRSSAMTPLHSPAQ